MILLTSDIENSLDNLRFVHNDIVSLSKSLSSYADADYTRSIDDNSEPHLHHEDHQINMLNIKSSEFRNAAKISTSELHSEISLMSNLLGSFITQPAVIHHYPENDGTISPPSERNLLRKDLTSIHQDMSSWCGILNTFNVGSSLESVSNKQSNLQGHIFSKLRKNLSSMHQDMLAWSEVLNENNDNMSTNSERTECSETANDNRNELSWTSSTEDISSESIAKHEIQITKVRNLVSSFDKKQSLEANKLRKNLKSIHQDMLAWSELLDFNEDCVPSNSSSTYASSNQSDNIAIDVDSAINTNIHIKTASESRDHPRNFRKNLMSIHQDMLMWSEVLNVKENDNPNSLEENVQSNSNDVAKDLSLDGLQTNAIKNSTVVKRRHLKKSLSQIRRSLTSIHQDMTSWSNILQTLQEQNVNIKNEFESFHNEINEASSLSKENDLSVSSSDFLFPITTTNVDKRKSLAILLQAYSTGLAYLGKLDGKDYTSCDELQDPFSTALDVVLSEDEQTESEDENMSHTSDYQGSYQLVSSEKDSDSDDVAQALPVTPSAEQKIADSSFLDDVLKEFEMIEEQGYQSSTGSSTITEGARELNTIDSVVLKNGVTNQIFDCSNQNSSIMDVQDETAELEAAFEHHTNDTKLLKSASTQLDLIEATLNEIEVSAAGINDLGLNISVQSSVSNEQIDNLVTANVATEIKSTNEVMDLEQNDTDLDRLVESSMISVGNTNDYAYNEIKICTTNNTETTHGSTDEHIVTSGTSTDSNGWPDAYTVSTEVKEIQSYFIKERHEVSEYQQSTSATTENQECFQINRDDSCSYSKILEHNDVIDSNISVDVTEQTEHVSARHNARKSVTGVIVDHFGKQASNDSFETGFDNYVEQYNSPKESDEIEEVPNTNDYAVAGQGLGMEIIAESTSSNEITTAQQQTSQTNVESATVTYEVHRSTEELADESTAHKLVVEAASNETSTSAFEFEVKQLSAQLTLENVDVVEEPMPICSNDSVEESSADSLEEDFVDLVSNATANEHKSKQATLVIANSSDQYLIENTCQSTPEIVLPEADMEDALQSLNPPSEVEFPEPPEDFLRDVDEDSIFKYKVNEDEDRLSAYRTDGNETSVDSIRSNESDLSETLEVDVTADEVIEMKMSVIHKKIIALKQNRTSEPDDKIADRSLEENDENLYVKEDTVPTFCINMSSGDTSIYNISVSEIDVPKELTADNANPSDDVAMKYQEPADSLPIEKEVSEDEESVDIGLVYDSVSHVPEDCMEDHCESDLITHPMKSLSIQSCHFEDGKEDHPAIPPREVSDDEASTDISDIYDSVLNALNDTIDLIDISIVSKKDDSDGILPEIPIQDSVDSVKNNDVHSGVRAVGKTLDETVQYIHTSQSSTSSISNQASTMYFDVPNSPTSADESISTLSSISTVQQQTQSSKITKITTSSVVRSSSSIGSSYISIVKPRPFSPSSAQASVSVPYVKDSESASAVANEGTISNISVSTSRSSICSSTSTQIEQKAVMIPPKTLSAAHIASEKQVVFAGNNTVVKLE